MGIHSARDGTTLGMPVQRPFTSSTAGKLELLNGFELTIADRVVPVSAPTQRLLALLATRDRPLQRAYIAGLLWPDARQERAMGNLRSALRQCGQALVQRTRGKLALASGVAVDYRQSISIGHDLLAGRSRLGGIDAMVELLSGELLPDWVDDWLETCRREHHQLRLHALEALAEQLLKIGFAPQAVRASLAAVNAEPLRESAHRALIRALIAEGNRAQAIRHYMEFSRHVHRELSVAPSFRLQDVLDPGIR